MDGDFIANETYQSVSRNFIEFNEPSNDGKNSDICREEIIYWNEYPTHDIEEFEGENPMKNEFEPFVSHVFLVKKRLSRNFIELNEPSNDGKK